MMHKNKTQHRHFLLLSTHHKHKQLNFQRFCANSIIQDQTFRIKIRLTGSNLLISIHTIIFNAKRFVSTKTTSLILDDVEVGFEGKNILFCFDYNQSLVSLATHSQSRLNSFQTVKTLFLHCSTCTSRLHLFSRLCPIFGRRLAPNNDTQ